MTLTAVVTPTPTPIADVLEGIRLERNGITYRLARKRTAGDTDVAALEVTLEPVGAEPITITVAAAAVVNWLVTEYHDTTLVERLVSPCIVIIDGSRFRCHGTYSRVDERVDLDLERPDGRRRRWTASPRLRITTVQGDAL